MKILHRNKKGEYARLGFIARVKHFIYRKIILPTLLLGLPAAGYTAYQWHDTSVTYLRKHGVTTPLQVFAEQPEKTISLAEFNALVKKEQDAIIDDLGQCETSTWKSLGFDSQDAVITFDPDKSGKASRVPSYGWLQFKTTTMQMFYGQLHDAELTQLEARDIAEDHEEAREVARFAIFVEKVAPDHWVNCFTRPDYVEEYHLKARVDALQDRIIWFNELTD